MTTASSPCADPNRCLDISLLGQYTLFQSELSQQTESVPTLPTVGWELSPSPLQLSLEQKQVIEKLGPALFHFSKSLDLLYRQSVKGTQPAWISQWLDLGKPSGLLKYAQMKRFKTQVPIVIRPDLLMTKEGFSLTEIDSVPGGIGFITGMNDLYKKSGFDVLESPHSMGLAFVEALRAQVPDVKNPVVAVVVSDEASDYLQEWRWLEQHLQENNYLNDIQLLVVHPKQLSIVRDKLVFVSGEGRETPIDLVYRFFELFDLPNIPNIELIQFAIKKQWVACTPPFKPHLEEKLAFALFHHPLLQSFWKNELGDNYTFLLPMIPKTWVMDPSVLPPGAVIAELMVDGEPVQSFQSLKNLSQKARQLVVKPSGFSPLAWGSRGVTIGHDLSQEEWNQRVDDAMMAFETTPYILQEYRHPKRHKIKRLDLKNQSEVDFYARTRLCPYYLIQGDSVELAGVLATSCPEDKKIIHGMKDAILSPVC